MWRRHVAQFLEVTAYVILTFCFYFVVARMATWVAREPGWPENHERLSMFMRVESFRRAFAVKDWLPLWSPFCFGGHGSPGPLFYHRFFNILGGLLALKMGSTAATKSVVTLLIAVGAFGMHRAAKQLGASWPFRFAAGVLFAISPYVLTDWMVRGAVAELAAMVLVPWFFAEVVRFSRGENTGIQLGLVAALMFHAHSMICLFALVIPVIAAMVSIVHARPGERASAWADVLNAGIRFAVVFLLIAGPFLIAVYLLKTRVSLQRLEVFDPSRGGYVPIGRYLADPYDWGMEFRGMSVEVGRALVGLFIATWFASAFTRTRVWSAGVTTLFITTALYIFMQHPASAWIYRTVPGAPLLQFPWRLLVFIVPGLILLTCVAGQALITTHRRSMFVVAGAFAIVIGWQFLFNLDSQKLTYARFTDEEIGKSIDQLDGPNNDEYLPHLVLNAPAVSPFVTMSGCVATSPLPTETPHLGRFALWVAPKDKCVVEFNQFCTPLLMVVVSRGTVGCSTRGLITVTVPNGPHAYMRIQRRSLVSAIKEMIRSRREG
jgi:hypothetical protein